MSATEDKAVFLSYASQDAESARRICEALREAGAEVWFDENELVGGDAWDAKIRKQIKECALFVPIVSANTQARREGYFRLEWKLAAQRTHTMADGTPFLLPVVIHETRDGEALVPEEFRAVQWTRLAGGQAPTAFCARVKMLLDGSAGSPPASALLGGQRPARPASGDQRHPNRRLGWLAPTAILIAGVLIWLWPHGAAPDEPVAPRQNSTPSSAPAVPLTEARQLITKAWLLINKPEAARAELDAADALCKRAAALDPTDANVWAAWGHVHTWMIHHGLDPSPARREAARDATTRAMQLAPTSFEARLAQATYWLLGGGARDAVRRAEAGRMLRELLREAPDEPRCLLALGMMLPKKGGPTSEKAEILERLALNPAFTCRALSHLAYAFYTEELYMEAEAAVDRSIAAQPMWFNLATKSSIAVAWLGDLALAKATLDRMPPSALQEDWAIGLGCAVYRVSREPLKCLEVLSRTSRNWISSNPLDGPKALEVGMARLMAGQSEAAQRDFRRALELINERLLAEPNDTHLLELKAEVLYLVGEKPEADQAFRLLVDLGGTMSMQLLVLAQPPEVVLDVMEAFFDETDDAAAIQRVPNLQKVVGGRRPRNSKFTAAVLRLSPIYDPLRNHPRFIALLARAEADPRKSPKAKPAAQLSPASAVPLPKPDPKSVVVLPFANLSGDPAQEYFSDGVTEEILNALARERALQVPGRASSFSFKGKNATTPEIARTLNVAQVIEGSVRKAGNRVRIAVSLTRAADGFRVREDLGEFTEELTDIFALQDKVARVVVEKLTKRTTTMSPVAVLTRVPEAYDAYLKGRALMAQTSPSWLPALAPLRRAVELDPEFALAWANLGRLGAILYMNGYDPSGLSVAGKAIDRALQLQPDSAEGHFARAYLLQAEGAPIEHIEREIAIAEKTRPNDPEILLARSLSASARGDRDASLALLEQAVRLDPRNGQHVNYLGLAYLSRERFADAESTFGRAFEILGSSIPAMNRGRTFFHWTGDGDRMLRTIDEIPAAIRDDAYWEVRAMVHYWVEDYAGALDANAREPLLRGFRIRAFRAAEIREAMGDLIVARRNYEAALPIAEKLCEQYPKSRTPQAILALTFAGLGRKEEALLVARKAVDAGGTSGTGGDPHLNNHAVLAQVLARFGQMDEALEIMKALAAKHSVRRHHLLRSPDWRNLRKDPRFQAIAEDASR